MPRPRADLTGRVYGRLAVVERAADATTRDARWICRCECGKVVIVLQGHLLSGHTRSCGCLRKETASAKAFVHGRSHFSEYHIWSHMRRRCGDESYPSYDRYGGRGITVCDEWEESFTAFLRDMGPRPSKDFTLERIDNHGGYSKDNCKWATAVEQNNNKRSNIYVTAFGRTLPVKEWSAMFGVKGDTICYRVWAGWPSDLAVSRKVGLGKVMKNGKQRKELEKPNA